MDLGLSRDARLRLVEESLKRRPIEEVAMSDVEVKQAQDLMQESDSEPRAEDTGSAEQMCCDGKQTAVEHREHSGDGKCCSDA